MFGREKFYPGLIIEPAVSYSTAEEFIDEIWYAKINSSVLVTDNL